MFGRVNLCEFTRCVKMHEIVVLSCVSCFELHEVHLKKIQEGKRNYDQNFKRGKTEKS